VRLSGNSEYAWRKRVSIRSQRFNYLWIVAITLLRVIRLRTAGVDLDHMDPKKFNWIKQPSQA
jgi:hypothetical protein